MAPAEAAETIKTEAVERSPSGGNPHDAARQGILQAVTDFDPRALDLAVRRAMVLGAGHEIFEGVFGPALREIGDLWHAGKLSVAQEHMASYVLSNASADLLRLVQPDGASPCAVLACFAEEQHTIPLLGAAFRLTNWRFRVQMLGARTPPEAIADVVREIKPRLVGLSVTAPPAEDKVDDLIDRYAAACGDVPWVVGGASSEALRDKVESVGGVVVGTRDIDDVLKSLSLV